MKFRASSSKLAFSCGCCSKYSESRVSVKADIIFKKNKKKTNKQTNKKTRCPVLYLQNQLKLPQQQQNTEVRMHKKLDHV